MLLQQIQERIKPKLHIFGHVHEANGYTEKDGIHFVNAATKPHTIHYYKTIRRK